MSEYTLTDFKIADFKDRNGNSWCTATFEEHGEPVTWVVKDPAKVTLGTKYNGEIKDWTASTGKVMERFYREQTGGDSTSFDKPAWKDNSKDITLGLVYKTFVQAEGKLPSNQQEWAVIIANWNTLVNISAGTFEGTSPEKTTGTLKEKWDKTKSATNYDPPEDVPIESYDDEG